MSQDTTLPPLPEPIAGLVKDIHDAIGELASGTQYHDLTAAIDELAAIATQAPQPEHDVRKIMLDVVSGWNGEGVEVYAKSVRDVEDTLTKMGARIEELEGRAQQAQGVPSGMALVPIVPTEKMLSAGYEAGLQDADAWTAMLAVAPQAEPAPNWAPETCAVCDEGKALLIRCCSHCGSEYAGLAEQPGAVGLSEREACCPNCQGSGEITVMTSHLGPDDYEHPAVCDHCDGDGGLAAAYQGVVKLLEKERDTSLKLSGKLYGLRHHQERRDAFLLEVGEDMARWHDPIGYWKDYVSRAALAAAQPVAAGRSQHDADSAELRSLCQARDQVRRQRDALLAEMAGHEAAIAHLSNLVDDLRRLLAEAMRIMKALHESATPDDGPDMDAIIPAGAFRQFVDDNANLMHLIHISPHELPPPPAATQGAKT